MSADVLCPVLAEQATIITLDSIDSLLLSNYSRTPGTKVTVSCLSEKTHELIGSNVVTCLATGQWDSTPTCSLIPPVSTVSTTTSGATGTITDAQYDMLPYLVALSILGLVAIMLIILLSYALYRNKKAHQRDKSESLFGRRSSTSQHSDLWVELANPRHFRCHELSAHARDLSHDSFNFRYQQPFSSWPRY